MGNRQRKIVNGELYNYPLREVEGFIQVKKDHDLSLNHFATLSAIRGQQFKREMFSSMLKFKDLIDFLQVFPDVQRTVNSRKVTKIKNYVLSGLNDEEENLRFFSAITATCRGGMFYDESTLKVAINTHESKLSVNDGQHRMSGISEAIKELTKRYEKEKDEELKNDILIQLNELKNMVVPLVIYNHIDEDTEKQLFHDLNNLASRPSRSATIKLAQTDLFSQMAREVSIENRYLVHYGVEMDKMSIHGEKNNNTILLTTVYSMIKLLLGKKGNAATTTSSLLAEENYHLYKNLVMNTIDKIFSMLPHDLDDRDKYILSRSYALKGITKFYYDAIEVHNVPENEVLRIIKDSNYDNDIEQWKQYGASLSVHGNLIFTTYQGVLAIYTSLINQIPKHDLFSLDK